MVNQVELDEQELRLKPILRNNIKAFLYIKTFKTGSSTLTNLFHNYCVKYNLSCPMVESCKKLMYRNKWNKCKTWNGEHKLDMWVGHIYFKSKIYNLVPQCDGQIVSIVRNPLNRFISGYNWAIKYRNFDENIHDFIRFSKHDYKIHSIKYNVMCQQLIGNDWHDLDHPNWKNILNGNWLILITEEWKKSLLLLKHAYHLSDNDLIYMDMKRSGNKYKNQFNLSEKEKDLINEHNYCDWMLYNISVQVFNQRIRDIYGSDVRRMNADIERMDKVRYDVMKYCQNDDIRKNDTMELYCESIFLDNGEWLTWAKNMKMNMNLNDRDYLN